MPGSALYSTTCETPEAKSIGCSRRGANSEETAQTTGPPWRDRRRHLRRAELPAGGIRGHGVRPDGIRRRLEALASLQHRGGKRTRGHSTQDSRDRTVEHSGYASTLRLTPSLVSTLPAA